MRNARDRGLRQRSGVIHAFDSTRQTIRSKKRQATEQTRGEEANTNKEPKTEPRTFQDRDGGWAAVPAGTLGSRRVTLLETCQEAWPQHGRRIGGAQVPEGRAMHQEIRITRVVFESLALRGASGMFPL